MPVLVYFQVSANHAPVIRGRRKQMRQLEEAQLAQIQREYEATPEADAETLNCLGQQAKRGYSGSLGHYAGQ